MKLIFNLHLFFDVQDDLLGSHKQEDRTSLSKIRATELFLQYGKPARYIVISGSGAGKTVHDVLFDITHRHRTRANYTVWKDACKATAMTNLYLGIIKANILSVILCVTDSIYKGTVLPGVRSVIRFYNHVVTHFINIGDFTHLDQFDSCRFQSDFTLHDLPIYNWNSIRYSWSLVECRSNQTRDHLRTTHKNQRLDRSWY